MARPNKHKFRYKDVGRPTKLTPEIVGKLEEASSIVAIIKEVCYYAGIHRDTYYQWMRENPRLSDRLDDLRQRLPLKARQNIVARIEHGDIELSQWLLVRTNPEEFNPKMKVEHSGAIQTGPQLSEVMTPKMLEIKEKYEQDMFQATKEAWQPLKVGEKPLEDKKP